MQISQSWYEMWLIAQCSSRRECEWGHIVSVTLMPLADVPWEEKGTVDKSTVSTIVHPREAAETAGQIEPGWLE